MKTNGWDTVSLIDIARVNDVLAAAGDKLLLRFNGDLQSEPPVTAVGEYQSWSLVPGGSGRLLYVALAIKSGTLSVGAGTVSPLLEQFGLARTAGEVKVYDLAGVTAVFAMDLRLISGEIGEQQDLVFNISKVNYTMPPPGEGYVTPVNILDPSGQLDVAAQSLLGATLADDLVRNAAQVRYAFAQISPVPPASNSWLAPTASSYAYMEKLGGAKTYLGVLSVTDGRDISNLPGVIDPDSIRDGFSESYIISGDRVLQNMVMPVLPEAYQTSSGTFYFDAPSHMIRNGRPFQTFSVKSGAITYHPIIDRFEMRIDADGIRSQIWGRCDMEAGIWMSFSVGSWNKALFDPNTGILRFAPDSNPVSSHDADIPWYFYFLGPLAIAITALCVKVISDSIAGSLNDLLRSALSITRDPPRIVEWAGFNAFDVEMAGLNDSLYLMGQAKSGS